MKRKTIVVICLLGAAFIGGIRKVEGKDWARKIPKYTQEALRKYSIHFDSVVNNYYCGGWVGNGLLGACVYKEKGDTLCWELGRTDVMDHRFQPAPGRQKDNLYTACRLPIGKLYMPMSASKSDMTIRLDKAEVTGKMGNVSWRTYTPACHNVLIVEWEGEGALPDLHFQPAVSQSPRFIFPGSHWKPADYKPNPAPTLYRQGDYHICKQPLLAGGEYTTVWKVMNEKNKKCLLLSVAYSQSRTDTEKDAINDIEKVVRQSLKKVENAHLAWWKDFYNRSFVSVGEDQFDSFYWTQLYKLGSATRSDRMPIDLMGPWFHNRTPWPAIWWNLNIQLTYSPVFAVNHADLALPLLDMLDQNVENLKKNVPASFGDDCAAIGRTSAYDCVSAVEKEHGLLMWTLFYYWKYCRYAGDTVRMKEKFFPLLKLAVNYYRHLLQEGEDGRLHMPVSFSPEYGDAADCNFELSLLRWGCQTLVKTDETYGLNDPLTTECRRILDKLVPFPQDKDGLLIGKDVKLTYAHRHYSHLLMLYPLGILPLDVPENADLAKRSILYWLGFKQKGYYQGYTYTGASSMSTLLGDGEEARRYLKVMLDRYLQPNTFYRETGPVFETPMSALASFTEMLLLSRDSVIQVFPALPAMWKNIKIKDLRTEGGFEVSAVRQEGKTTEIRIKSLYGGPCLLRCDMLPEKMKIDGCAFEQRREGGLRLHIPAGKTAIVKLTH